MDKRKIDLLDTGPFKPLKRRYEPRTNKASHRAMEDKEFVAWDGEGWTDHTCTDASACRGGCLHHYCLFGSSTGHTVRAESLSTVDCLETMLEAAEENPHAIHVAYAFSYDVNMILRDVPINTLRRMFRDRVAIWGQYRLEYMPKKWFQVSRAAGGRESSSGDSILIHSTSSSKSGSGKTPRIVCRIQDIFSFFGMSFVKALKSWKVGTDVEWKTIEEGKDARGDFQLSMLDETVVPYWTMELRLLVGLANALRSTLYSGGFRIDRWFGPGAIASYIYKRQGQQKIMSRDLPEPIIDASCHAYAGGRFEGFRAGVFDGPVYSADINSAYPYALSLMPNMATGSWRYVRGDDRVRAVLNDGSVRLGMCHARYVVGRGPARTFSFPFPLFYRHASGDMSFPARNDVWVHMPEARMVDRLDRESAGAMFQSLEFVEAWVMDDDGTSPFAWVAELYEQRRLWKSEGNPAQLAAKLGLNSLYGKLAQRVGGQDGNIPPWHQLEWAGAITSTCRAMLYEASYMEHKGLIAYETDGIYSTVPLLRVESGNGLGQWECDEYTGMVYLQSGVYWLRDANGDWLPPKSRGIPTKHLDRLEAMNALSSKTSLTAENTQFIGFTLADMRHGRGWRTWERSTKEFVFGGAGKRAHVEWLCDACRTGVGWDEGLHNLAPRPVIRDDPPSSAHILPWRGTAPEAIEYLRRTGEAIE